MLAFTFITAALAALAVPVAQAAPQGVPLLSLTSLIPGLSSNLSPQCQSAMLVNGIPLLGACDLTTLISLLAGKDQEKLAAVLGTTTSDEGVTLPTNPFLGTYCSETCSTAFASFATALVPACGDEALFQATTFVTAETLATVASAVTSGSATAAAGVPDMSIATVSPLLDVFRAAVCTTPDLYVPGMKSTLPSDLVYCIQKQAALWVDSGFPLPGSLDQLLGLLTTPAAECDVCVSNQLQALQAVISANPENTLINLVLPALKGVFSKVTEDCPVK